jgi:hypothetical protein
VLLEAGVSYRGVVLDRVGLDTFSPDDLIELIDDVLDGGCFAVSLFG